MTQDGISQEARVYQKVELFQAILDELGLRKLDEQESAGTLSLGWDVDNDDGGPETFLAFLALYACTAPARDPSFTGVCYHSSSDTWSLYGRHNDSGSVVDRQKMWEILHELGIPTVDQEEVPQGLALDYARRLVGYFKKQLDLGRAVGSTASS